MYSAPSRQLIAPPEPRDCERGVTPRRDGIEQKLCGKRLITDKDDCDDDREDRCAAPSDGFLTAMAEHPRPDTKATVARLIMALTTVYRFILALLFSHTPLYGRPLLVERTRFAWRVRREFGATHRKLPPQLRAFVVYIGMRRSPVFLASVF